MILHANWSKIRKQKFQASGGVFMDYVKEAKALGFTQAALMPVSELVIVP